MVSVFPAEAARKIVGYGKQSLCHGVGKAEAIRDGSWGGVGLLVSRVGQAADAALGVEEEPIDGRRGRYGRKAG